MFKTYHVVITKYCLSIIAFNVALRSSYIWSPMCMTSSLKKVLGALRSIIVRYLLPCNPKAKGNICYQVTQRFNHVLFQFFFFLKKP